VYVQTVLPFIKSLSGEFFFIAGILLTFTPFVERFLVKPWKKWDSARTKIQFHIKDLRWIGAACLLVAFYQAWSNQHDLTEDAIHGKDGRDEARAKFVACDTERSVKSSLADAYSRQLSDQGIVMANQQQTINGQQASVNTCVVALGKLGKPEPLKTTVKVASLGAAKGTNNGKDFVLVVMDISTNKPVSPLHGTLKCRGKYAFVDAALAAGNHLEITSKKGMISDTEARIQIESPAWSPTTPLVVAVTAAEDLEPCELRLD
jgi:hypothetical protein